jgi:hypothetical protein
MYEMRPHTDVYRDRPVALSWKVPVFCNNDWMAVRLLDICRDLGVQQPFHVAYGAPLCAWAGGRPSALREQLSERDLERYFAAYDERGVKVALTMSRLQIEPAALGDGYCERILRVCERHAGQVICVDDALAAHVRDRHPGIELIASLDKSMCELRPDFAGEAAYYRRLLETFDEVVIRCEAALDDRMVAELADVADRCEVITNQTCMRDCQACDRHIASMEAFNGPNAAGAKVQNCYYLAEARDFAARIQRTLFVGESRIRELSLKGFTKMKLAGRNQPLPRLMDQFATYLFEPSGIVYDIKNELIRQWQAAEHKLGRPMAPYTLP